MHSSGPESKSNDLGPSTDVNIDKNVLTTSSTSNGPSNGGDLSPRPRKNVFEGFKNSLKKSKDGSTDQSENLENDIDNSNDRTSSLDSSDKLTDNTEDFQMDSTVSGGQRSMAS